MNLAKRVLSTLLSVAMFVSLLAIPVKAEETAFEKVQIKISNGDNITTYPAIYDKGDIFLPASTYGLISRYTYSVGSDNIGYTLGSKIIAINPQSQQMQIPILKVNTSIPIIAFEGETYISASSILPWLNVECNVNEGILEIIPDGFSLWEAVDNLEYQDYMFNLYEEYGDSVSSIAGLTAWSVFDTVLNLRWDRLVPADGTIAGAANGGSVYEYECYKEALISIAQYDPFTYANAETIIKSAVTVNKGLDKIEEVFGVDEEKIQVDLDSYLMELGTDAETMEMFYDLAETWQTIREGIKGYEQISKYMSILSVLKTYELVIETDTEYRDYLNWILESGVEFGGNQTVFENAVKTTLKSLDENTGVLYSYYIELGSQLLADMPQTVMDAIINNFDISDEFLQGWSAYEKSIWGSIGQYMAVARLVYGKILPFAEGAEGMAKSSVIEYIQDYCWGIANSLSHGELTAETISHIRQSYIVSLKAARLNFEAQQETMDVKLLGVLPIINGEGLLDYKFDRIDEKLLQLLASADSTLNDSIDGKLEYTLKLKDLFTNLSMVNPGDSDGLIGTWSVFMGGSPGDNGIWTGISMYNLDFRSDGSVAVTCGRYLSEYFASYYGNWTAVQTGETSFEVNMDLMGGTLVLGEEAEQNPHDLTLNIEATSSQLVVSKVSGDDVQFPCNGTYERDLTVDMWIARQQQQISSSVSATDCIGEWVLTEGNIDERILTIHSVNDNVVVFDLFYYRLASFENQTATINSDGTASFTITVGSESIQGKLGFNENLTVYITKSMHPFVRADLTIYSRKIAVPPDANNENSNDNSVTLAEWETMSDSDYWDKCVFALENALRSHSDIWDAKILFTGNDTVVSGEYGEKCLVLENVQANGYWLAEYGFEIYAVGLPHSVTFYYWQNGGSTDIGWVYDWNGNLIQDYNGQGISEYLLSYIIP